MKTQKKIARDALFFFLKKKEMIVNVFVYIKSVVSPLNVLQKTKENDVSARCARRARARVSKFM